MRSPWLRLIASLLLIGSLFGVYRVVATPLLEPPLRAEADSAIGPYAGPLRSVERMPELARLFQPDDWELAYPQILETEYGVLLMKSYSTLDDGRLLIEPCTLVLKSEGEAGAAKPSPIVLRAPAGAVIAFDRPLDLRKASVGKLMGGLLQGDIHIRRAADAANPALDLHTRNVQIDESRIWTTQEVTFRYGQTHGSGRDLLITLPKINPGAAQQTRAESAPIRFMELVHVDRIHVDLTSLTKPKTTVAKPVVGNSMVQSMLPAATPKSLDITCEGPFRIDFLQQAAAFEKNVQLTLHHEGAKVDRLQCNLLAAYFSVDQPAPTTPRAKPVAAGNSAESSPPPRDSFQIRRIVATGNPVTLDAPNYKAGLQSERLEYDFEQRLLILGDSHSVHLRHERFEVTATGGIEYQFPLIGSLGDLWAGGPGEFRGQISPESPDHMVATWGQRLQIHRQGDHQLMSLEGGASVGMSQFGGLQGEKLYMWLKPVAAQHSATEPGSSLPKLTYEPDRMLAEGGVVIQSPMLSGRVERLEAWFREMPTPLPNLNVDQHAAAMRRVPPPLAEPGQSLPNRTPPKQSFQLLGRNARLHFLRAGGAYELDEVAVEGGVDLREVATQTGEKPLTVRGELLELKQAQSPQATLRMLGNPAQLTGRGLTIRGSELLVDRAANTIDINSPGHLQLPLTADMPLTAFTSVTTVRTNPGRLIPMGPPPVRPPAPPTMLDITWQKGCRFDGRTARFHNAVEIRSGMQFASANALSVTLDRPVSFQAVEGPTPQPAPQPQLLSLQLEGNVQIEQQERDERGSLLSMQRAALPMISINQQTGQLESNGPGWFETVRYGSSLAPPTAGSAASTPRANAPAELIHLRVHYAQGIRGDIRSKQVRCFDQVQAIYGPISNWDQRLDLFRPETHGTKTVIMRCDQIQAAAMGANGKQAFEMVALGNTSIQGEMFTATCHRISYDGTKELLIMEGDGRRDAQVTQQTRPGGQQSQAAARQIFFSLRDQSFRVHDAKFLDLNGPFAAGGF